MSRRDEIRKMANTIRTPAEPTPAPAKAPTPALREQHRGPTPTTGSKTTLSLPTSAAQRLRQWSTDTGRSLGDCIITGLIEHQDAITEKYQADDRRVRLGLSPLNGPATPGPRTQISIRLPRLALAELDNTAANLGLTRSALTAAILEIHLPIEVSQ